MTSGVTCLLAAATVVLLAMRAPAPARRPDVGARATPPPLARRRRSSGGLAASVPPLRRRRDLRRDAALPDWLAHLASALRAGHALGPALIATAADAPAPLREEVEELAATLRHGSGVVEALDRWRAAPRSSPAVALAATSLVLGVRTGGPIAQSVDRVAATLRERLEARAEVQTLAAQARSSAMVLVAAPLAFTALVSSIDRHLAAFLLTTPLGLACVATGLTLDAVGAAWMARITAQAAR